jgi:peptidoglycan/LPS O-acetylase OafA/YrhL
MLRPGLTRFILAVIVVISHFSNAIMLGKFAVCCFFILSGYWISSMYEKKYSKKKNPLKVFYISRLWRLFPMYYLFFILGLISTILFMPPFFSVVSGLGFMSKLSAVISNLFIVGQALPKYRILGPAWSLDVEIQLYLVFPLLVYLIRKTGNSLLFSLSLLFVSLVIYLYFKDQVQFTLLSYLFLFLFGSLAYMYRITFPPVVEKLSAAVFLLILGSQYLVPSLHHHFMEENSYYYFFMTLVLIIFATPVLINSVHAPTNGKDKAFGELSYIVYLSHWVWIQPYYAYVWSNPSAFSNGTKLMYAGGVLLLTGVSSWLAYQYVDRRFEKSRHKWVGLQKDRT